MNLAHIHLLLNHFPTVGTAVGLGLFLVALTMKSADLQRASLALFVVIALIAMPTYMSGNAAMEVIQNNEGVNKDVIEAHQSWALLAYTLLEFGGLLAWLALWQSRSKGQISAWLRPAVLMLIVVSFALMAKAANIGGEIMHPEIAGPQGPATSGIEALRGSVLGPAIVESSWLWAACETLHFMGLAVLFGVVLILDLRMLGVVKAVPFAALHRLLPWAAGAFAVNTATGMVFFIAAFEQYTTNDVFHWKLVFILLAGLNALYFTVFDQPWRVEAGSDAPWQAKAVAASALVLWIGVIYCGRMLPFLGSAF